MVEGTAAATCKAAGGAGCHIRYPAHQRGCWSTGRTLFPRDILVLGHRHRLYLAAVHPDGPGAGATLSWLREGETILDADQICLLQHGLPTLLRPMVVLALVLLVVGELFVSQKGGCFGCQYGTQYGTVFATFGQCRIFGYKNGTFNAALLH